MKKAKLNKQTKKEQKHIEKDTYSFKNLILIILIIIVILGVFYGITTLFVKPVYIPKDEVVSEINSEKISLNNLLNRKEKEYYVLATKKSDNEKVDYIKLYNNYIDKYSKQDQAITFYSVNLDDIINKSYVGKELKISNEISEIKLNDEVLFKIKNNTVEEYFVGSKKILDELNNLIES